MNLIKKRTNISDSWIHKRNYALIILLYATGMRVTEALNFNMNNLENNWIRIDSGKGSKDRYVPIAEEAVNALNIYIKECPYPLDKAFFISYKKTLLSRISAYNIVKQLMGLGPHSMRHHFATHMIINGADVCVVSEMLGHASLITTQIYTHIQKPQLRETVLRCHPMAKEDIYAI